MSLILITRSSRTTFLGFDIYTTQHQHSNFIFVKQIIFVNLMIFTFIIDIEMNFKKIG